MEALKQHVLPVLQSRGIQVPSYARTGAPGVLHLGLGAFHRAHQALVFDALLQAGDLRWGVLGVAMHNPAVADTLAAQDGLYVVQIADHVSTRWQVPGAILGTCVAARERHLVAQAISAAQTRWITLTVTEKGYTPALADLIVEGLAARQQAGLGGLTLASCDNLSHNGDKLKALCLQSAQKQANMPHWIESCCVFPNSMVDRIVPASTPLRRAAAADALGCEDGAALGTEGFWEWVIEDRFCDPGDAACLRQAGVNVVTDVAPFEDAKLRLLNASHSAMACIGAVAGLHVISDGIQNPDIHTFIHDLMTQEVGPQLRRTDWAEYRDALLTRFANPSLQHSVHQIATDSSQKIPQRWVPSVLGAFEKNLSFERLAFAAAAWIRYLRGVDDGNVAYAVNDPMASSLQKIATACGADANQATQVLARLIPIWGEVLPGHRAWVKLIARWLDCINHTGILAALSELNQITARAASARTIHGETRPDSSQSKS